MKNPNYEKRTLKCTKNTQPSNTTVIPGNPTDNEKPLTENWETQKKQKNCEDAKPPTWTTQY